MKQEVPAEYEELFENLKRDLMRSLSQKNSNVNFTQKTTKNEVLKFVTEKRTVLTKEVSENFDIAIKTANSHLNNLVYEGHIRKVGVVTNEGNYSKLFYYF